MNKVYYQTFGLCPACANLEKVPAQVIQDHDQVFLEKACPIHGVSRVLISSDVQFYEASTLYVKPGQEPLKRNVTSFNGCPDSCGFCPQHRQHTCLPVIEITNKCQLNCPVCLKQLDRSSQLTLPEFAGIIDNLLATEGKVEVINLSGGEPTLHPDFAAMIDLALAQGVAQISVSTNGLALLENKALRDLFKRTGAIVALQFDSFSPAANLFFRGQDLTTQKKALISLLEAEDIHYSLVATVAKGINDAEISAIADFFFQSKALTLMFQPLSFTGNATSMDTTSHRLTIPCLVHQLEKSQYIQKGDFNALPCSHFSCFALSYYLQLEDGQYTSLKSFLGEEDFINICCNRILPGLDGEGFDIIQERLYNLWSAADSCQLNEKVLARIKNILCTMSQQPLSTRQKILIGAQHLKAIFIHHFMDVDTMDWERLTKCCNPYPQVGERLIPMCAENIFFQAKRR